MPTIKDIKAIAKDRAIVLPKKAKKADNLTLTSVVFEYSTSFICNNISIKFNFNKCCI